MNKKIVTSSLSVIFLTATLSNSQAFAINSNGTDYGNLNGQIKTIHTSR